MCWECSKAKQLRCTIPKKLREACMQNNQPRSHQALRNIWFSEHCVLAGHWLGDHPTDAAVVADKHPCDKHSSDLDSLQLCAFPETPFFLLTNYARQWRSIGYFPALRCDHLFDFSICQRNYKHVDYLKHTHTQRIFATFGQVPLIPGYVLDCIFPSIQTCMPDSVWELDVIACLGHAHKYPQCHKVHIHTWIVHLLAPSQWNFPSFSIDLLFWTNPAFSFLCYVMHSLAALMSCSW